MLCERDFVDLECEDLLNLLFWLHIQIVHRTLVFEIKRLGGVIDWRLHQFRGKSCAKRGLELLLLNLVGDESLKFILGLYTP